MTTTEIKKPTRYKLIGTGAGRRKVQGDYNMPRPKSPSPQSEYYSCSQFAAIYNMHILTVQRMCREGRLPAVRIGSRWKIRRTA